MVAGLGMAARRTAFAATASRTIGANDAMRVAVIGMGGTETIGGVGGRGHQLIASLLQVPDVRIAALCDVDQTFSTAKPSRSRTRAEKSPPTATCAEFSTTKPSTQWSIALPNHWHALATVWACQAGKDVYVEKPFSYNLWEGRQMVAAARKYGRMVQVGHSESFQHAAAARRLTTCAAASSARFVMRMRWCTAARDGIGTVNAPTPLPATVDYDLWCGPAPKTPLLRKQLHYEWHWFWATGNGEIGNNGIHVMDICRWALGQNQPPPRAMSIGGRFAFNDCGETANTQIALLDYQPAPLICEVRNVRAAKRPGRDRQVPKPKRVAS